MKDAADESECWASDCSKEGTIGVVFSFSAESEHDDDTLRFCQEHAAEFIAELRRCRAFRKVTNQHQDPPEDGHVFHWFTAGALEGEGYFTCLECSEDAFGVLCP